MCSGRLGSAAAIDSFPRTLLILGEVGELLRIEPNTQLGIPLLVSYL
jgi:hypothetical protein